MLHVFHPNHKLWCHQTELTSHCCVLSPDCIPSTSTSVFLTERASACKLVYGLQLGLPHPDWQPTLDVGQRQLFAFSNIFEGTNHNLAIVVIFVFAGHCVWATRVVDDGLQRKEAGTVAKVFHHARQQRAERAGNTPRIVSAWVGGRQFDGSFTMDNDGFITITFFKDRINIKKD